MPPGFYQVISVLLLSILLMMAFIYRNTGFGGKKQKMLSMYVYIYVICTYIHMFICVYICACVYIHIFICTYINLVCWFQLSFNHLLQATPLVLASLKAPPHQRLKLPYITLYIPYFPSSSDSNMPTTYIPILIVIESISDSKFTPQINVIGLKNF